MRGESLEPVEGKNKLELLLRDFGTSKEDQEVMWRELEEHGSLSQNSYAEKKSLTEFITQREISADDFENLSKRIKAERTAVVSSRSLKDIVLEFNLSKFQFTSLIENKKVLDVGAGKSTLASEIEQKKINTRIVSVDISQRILLENKGKNEKVSADAQQLPFSSGEFDTVMATWSVPVWSNSEKEVEDSFQELYRATKPGGYLLITPISSFVYRPALGKQGERVGYPMAQAKSSYVHSVEVNPYFAMLLEMNQVKFVEILNKLRARGEDSMVLLQPTDGADDNVMYTPASVIIRKKM